MNYKKSIYQVAQIIAPDIYLCSSFRTGSHLLLSKAMFCLYDGDTSSLQYLSDCHPQVFERLVAGEFLMPNDINEKEDCINIRMSEINDRSFHHVIINPTLDCNLSFTKSHNIDTFSLTLRNIRRIQQTIPQSHVSVRINFDGETLNGFDSILSDIRDLDRQRTKIIVKKVWQVDSEDVSKDLTFECLEKLFKNDFIADYYSQGGTCFADRKNQVTINFDGNVFKCTTITHFDEPNALGHLDINSGMVIWDENKIKYLDNSTFPKTCVDCKVFPFCGGHCMKHISEGNDKGCFLRDLDMSVEEYAEIQFKINVIKSKVYAHKTQTIDSTGSSVGTGSFGL